MKPCSNCLIQLDDLNTFCAQCSGSLAEYLDVQQSESLPDYSTKVCPSCNAINESAYFCCSSCGQMLFTAEDAVRGRQPETGSVGEISPTDFILNTETTGPGGVSALEISEDNFLESDFLEKFYIDTPTIQTAKENLKETTADTHTKECESQAGNVEPPARKYSLIIGVSYVVGLVFLVIFMQINLSKKSHIIQIGVNTSISKEVHRAEVSSDPPPTPPIENRQQEQTESRMFETDNLVEGGHHVEGDKQLAETQLAETERQDPSVREENLLPSVDYRRIIDQKFGRAGGVIFGNTSIIEGVVTNKSQLEGSELFWNFGLKTADGREYFFTCKTADHLHFRVETTDIDVMKGYEKLKNVYDTAKLYIPNSQHEYVTRKSTNGVYDGACPSVIMMSRAFPITSSLPSNKTGTVLSSSSLPTAQLSVPPASKEENDSELITITPVPAPALEEDQPEQTDNDREDISASDSQDITHSSSEKSESPLQLLTDHSGVSDKPGNKPLHLAKEQAKIPVSCRSLYKKLSVGKVLNSQETDFLLLHCN